MKDNIAGAENVILAVLPASYIVSLGCPSRTACFLSLAVQKEF